MTWATLVAIMATAMGLASSDHRLDSETRRYTTGGHGKQVVCYWGTWANYRPSKGKFTPENIDPRLCTHLVYSFAGLDGEKSQIKSLDPWMDLEDGYGLAGFRKAVELKYVNPKLKVTLAIGGWNEGSVKYSNMAKNTETRKTFVDSAVDFLKKYNFDGMDLDWEYPGKRGGSKEDKSNFIKLIRELRASFDRHDLILTAAIGAGASTIDISYDVPLMYKYLDLVHVMCYDYHGKWDKRTGHNAPLYGRPDEPAKDSILNIQYTIEYLLKKGARPEKTVLGIPFYGRAFMLNNPHDHRMGAKSKDTSFSGPYTKEDGFMGYNEICEELTTEGNTWTVEFDQDHMAPYAYDGLRWVSYDDEKSIRKKTEFAFDHGLGGVMVWSVDTDDFLGVCGGPKYPLLRTINNALYQREQGNAGRAAAGSMLKAEFVITFVLLFFAL